MKLLRDYFLNNRRTLLCVLFFWIAGSVCGSLCGGASQMSFAQEYVSSSVSGELSFWEVVKNGLESNINFTAIILVLSSFWVFVPVTFALAAFKGFAYSMTTTLFIKFYSLKGILLSLITVVIPLCISIGAYFAMFVCALRFPLDCKKANVHPEKYKKPHWKTHIIMMAFLCGFLCVTTFFEAILSRLIPFLF